MIVRVNVALEYFVSAQKILKYFKIFYFFPGCIFIFFTLCIQLTIQANWFSVQEMVIAKEPLLNYCCTLALFP